MECGLIHPQGHCSPAPEPASALLLPYRRGLGTTGFLIAGVVGLAMVVNILISDRRRH